MKVKKASLPSPVEVAILGYCLWQASDLIPSWLTAPAERWAWIAFLVWCLPVICHLSHCIYHQEPKGRTQPLLAMAIAFSLVAGIGSLHILGHIGLALAMAGLLPFQPQIVIWLFTAISWLPSFGWMIKSLPFDLIPLLQIGIATAGSAFLIIWFRRHLYARE